MAIETKDEDKERDDHKCAHTHDKSHKHQGHHCHCHDEEDINTEDDDDEEEEEVSLRNIIIAAIFFIVGILIEHLAPVCPVKAVQELNSSNPVVIQVVYMVFYFAAYIICGLGVLKEAVEGLTHGEVFGEEFLMAIATIGAIVIGEYSEAVAVMILFQLGEYLEGKAVDSSKKSITDLMDIRPDKANVRCGSSTEEILAGEVKIDDIIVVKPGERIPLDGVIVSGKSLVDTSALTGESVPREVCEGEEILSGFVNTNGTLEIRVTKEFGQSTVSRILDMVEKAQSKKAKVQKFIKRLCKVYTPAVCAIAVCVAVIPSVLTGDVKTWIYRALEILVVSCPCALVISVPLSFFAGLGLASKNGILVKGSNYMELLSQTKTAVFDKTGTLTKGVFQVTEIHLADESISKDEIVEIATHAEYYSTHPISRSLKSIHNCPKCGTIDLKDNEEISGHGLKCILEGRTVLVGNERLMKRENVTGYSPCPKNDAGTIVHIAVDGQYKGHIVISDITKDDARKAVEDLHKAGIRETVMLTGDTRAAAEATAGEIGIDTVHAELLPQDKVSRIEELIKSNENTKHRVAFVGDGINDAPVLTRADVGIAMGGMGSDAAIEAADVVIMDDKPSNVALAVKIAKKTMLNVKENAIFALMIKTLIMVLCACGIANMWIAVFGDVGVTMIAVLNCLRLLYCNKNIK